LNNRLEGNSGNNVLAGGLGKDTLVGGLGNDIYVLSDNLDTLVDAGGIDTIRSSLDIVLATDFENAELVGIADATATGNAADNLLQGNMGDNILEGKGGVDTLSGGAGSDQFVLGYNGLNTVADQITDFVSGQDLLVIDLASFGISSANLSLQSSGTLNAASFVKGPGVRALDTNDYFLLDTAQSLLKFDPDGSGPLAALDVVRFVGVVDAAFNGADLFIAV
jgi:Ca2+-binding RTX toxin-like protein